MLPQEKLKLGSYSTFVLNNGPYGRQLKANQLFYRCKSLACEEETQQVNIMILPSPTDTPDMFSLR
jgi:hypothetical protein